MEGGQANIFLGSCLNRMTSKEMVVSFALHCNSNDPFSHSDSQTTLDSFYFPFPLSLT